MRRFFRVSAGGATDIGRKRARNEDFIGQFEPSDPTILGTSGCLYVVADGVGGAAYGAQASRYAVQKVLYAYYRRAELLPAERLVAVIQEASREIYAYSQQEAIGRTVATTLVAAVVWGDTLLVANVGDSRAYLLRDGEIVQITRVHNLVGEMVEQGLLSEEEARKAGFRNRLTRSVGGRPEPQVDVFTHPLQPGDRVLLCTDGLTRYASAEDLARLASEGEPQAAAERLVTFANQAGGADNVSALLVEIGELAPWEAGEASEDASLPPPPNPLEVPAPLAVMGKTIPLRRRRRPFWARGWLAVAGLFLVGWAIGLGLVAAFRHPGVAPTPWAGGPMPAVPSSTLTATSSPFPTVGSAAGRASGTLSPPGTSPPVSTPLPSEQFGCLGEIGADGTFYGLLVRMGLLDVAARGDFWATLVSQEGFRTVLYLDQSALPSPEQVVDLTAFQKIAVPDAPPAEDPAAWTAFEDAVRRFAPTTVVVLPLVDRARCEKGQGWWRRFQSPPSWIHPLHPLTPEATP